MLDFTHSLCYNIRALRELPFRKPFRSFPSRAEGEAGSAAPPGSPYPVFSATHQNSAALPQKLRRRKMKKKYSVFGMSCAACANSVQKAVSRLPGVTQCSVNLVSNTMEVEFENLSDEQICNAVNAIGFKAKIYEETSYTKDSSKKKLRLVISIVFLVLLMYVSMGSMIGLPIPSFISGMENAIPFAITQLVLLIPIIVLNFSYFTSGYSKLFRGHPNMDTLVALGSTASVLYGLYAIIMMKISLDNGDMETLHALHMELYFESAGTILTLVTVGKFIESRSKAKTGESLRMILDLSGKNAVRLSPLDENTPLTTENLRSGNYSEATVSVEDLREGDVILVKSGMSLPVDGVIVEGGANIDQSAITGESLPVYRSEGEDVIGGTINRDGVFCYRAKCSLKESTISKIAEMVDEAANSKAPIARLADKVSGIFVPTVMILSALTFIVWLLIGKPWNFALERGISVLVISCPCALGLATPISIMVATGVAAKNKILLKNAAALETLHSVKVAAIDKTGTITTGELRVDRAVSSDDRFYSVLGALESSSSHPLALAVTDYLRENSIPFGSAENSLTVPGKGIEAKLDGKDYRCGNRKFIEEWGVNTGDVDTEGGSVIFAADKRKLLGYVIISDTVKESSAEAVAEFRSMGISTVILTGDNEKSARKVCAEVGADDVVADILPMEKADRVKALREKGKVMMIGDGINDAVALETADVGVAIGAGCDIAIESAGVVLTRNDLRDAVKAVVLSRKTIGNIKMNLFWAFFYNAISIPLAMGVFIPLGIQLNPMIASAAMSFSSVCVVLNSLRLMKALPKEETAN